MFGSFAGRSLRRIAEKQGKTKEKARIFLTWVHTYDIINEERVKALDSERRFACWEENANAKYK